MNKKVNSQKDINEYKIVVPMSNEAVNKIKSNITKSILGISIAGVMITGAATQVKAETLENPTAIVEEVKAGEIAQYDQEIASIFKNNSSTEDEEVAELKSATVNLADETSEASESASEKEAITEDKGDISLKDFIADDSLNKFFDFDKIEKEEEKLEISEENPSEPQGAGETATEEDKNLQKADDPNYGEDEKKIEDYDGSERYKQTDLQPGDPNQTLDKNDEKVEKDGFKFETNNPSVTSPSKTEYGYEITIDKKTGQRTYTKIDVTDNGRVPVGTGDKSMIDKGDKLTSESPDVTYKPTEDTNIDKSGPQRPLNYGASEETLKHINNKDNDSTSFGFKDNYTQDNPGIKYFGGNFGITYKVNPWPNENDKLELLKLNTEKYDSRKKYFVKNNEDIDIGIKVDNIDDSARERLVGQVYNPNTGKIVPGARAYIGSDDKIYIRMPEGAINEDGTINENSIFAKDPDYKGIQSLDVKFFARPRTADEFKAIAQAAEDEWDKGTYVETGAGTATINHKGQDVVIDRQGIDRYDHYNLIGDFKLNLDDTKFYEQKFNDENGKPTKDNVFSEVEPGKEFNINMKSDYGDNKEEIDKTPEDMKEAQKRREATAKANLQFFIENNKDKDGNLKDEEDRWKLSIGGKEIDLSKGDKELGVDDLSNIKVTAPSSAKAGEFVAIPVEYTYTNGSKDIHWFHFVVRESDNNIPTYESDAGTAETELTQTPKISDTEKDKKKNQPKSYKLAKTEYKDNKGNVWNVSIDKTTGEVKATVPENAYIPAGGAKLKVDVEVTYEEEVEINGQKETRTYKEKTQAEFYSIPETRQEVSKKFESELPYKTTFEYDDTIPAGKVVEEGGTVGKQKLVFSQIVVGNKKGALDEDGKFVEGKEAVKTEIITPAVDKVIKIGTKPAETTVEIPKGLDYELDYSKKGGDPEVVEEGNDGVVTIKTTRDPQTGEITVTKTTTTEAKNKKIKIPAGTEGTHEYTEKKPFTYDIQFDPDFYTNYPEAKDNYKIVTEGKVGEKTTKWTIKNSKIVGEPEITKDTDPTNAVIKVGQRDYTGTITHKESHEVPFEVEYKYSDELEAGQTKVEQKGEKGSYDIEYSQKIKNGAKDGEATSTKTNEKEAKKEIIVIGTKPLTKTVEKPFNTEYQYDENLEAGKTEEVTPGKNGKVTITTSYDKDQKKVATSETEEAGQNRVVKIGGKTNGTEKVKEEIPFEVEVRKDPSLKKGEWKYATDDEGNELKGEKGEQEKTLTIVNSKVTNTSDPTVTKKAKNAVILIGDEDFTGIVTNKVKKEVPYTVKIVKNPNLDAGTSNIKQQGKPGSKTYEYTGEIVNGKLKEGTKFTEKEITDENVEPTEHIIEIGTKPVENMCPNTDPTPGGGEDPDKPGTEEPGNPGGEEPGTPGTEDPGKPNEPGTPGETPDQPGTPGETPEEPGKPGETPDKPGTPGETPEEPGTPGETPEELGENIENPDTPDTPDTIENPEVDEVDESLDNPNETPESTEEISSGAKRLPKTGDGINVSMYGYLMGVLGSGFLGLGALKKKKEDEEEEN